MGTRKNNPPIDTFFPSQQITPDTIIVNAFSEKPTIYDLLQSHGVSLEEGRKLVEQN